MSTVIEVEQLSKAYHLGMIGGGTLKEDLSRWWAKRRGRPDPLSKVVRGDNDRQIGEHFWALHNVSFAVKEGEVLGIIGQNGAGKSTLLKILSQVIAPTSGEIKIKGRIASLLEVGTGFHPELTGRENTFLNGAILGMTKSEIRRKFEEIVAFSGVEEFIDTPVKRYSSGMYVRLAFAVAAHLEPEILIVDEVLAVGDAAFQKKCLGKMQDVAQHGRAVLFVSHNMAAVKTLCSRAVLLDGGKLVDAGEPEKVINRYLRSSAQSPTADLEHRTDRLGNGKFRWIDVQFLNKEGAPIEEVTSGEPVTIQAGYRAREPIDQKKIIIAISFFDEYRNVVAGFFSDEMGTSFQPFGTTGVVKVHIPHLLLRGGSYSLKLFASHFDTEAESFYDVIEDTATLRVMPGDYWRSGMTNRSGSFSVIPSSIEN